MIEHFRIFKKTKFKSVSERKLLLMCERDKL